MGVRPGYKQTEVGVIPEDWEAIPLGSLGTWKGGATPSMQNPVFWFNGTVPWVSSGDIKSTLISDAPMKIAEVAVKLSSTTLLPANSIMVVTRSGILRKFLPVAKNIVPIAINQDIKALIPDGKIVSDYLLHVFIGNGNRILATCLKSGTTVESIEYPWLKKYLVPLPPLPEQRAIAAVLSDVDALIASLDRLIDKKRDMKQAAMQELLTGKRRLPGFSGEWEVKRLGELGVFSKGKGIKKDDVENDGLPCIRYGEIYTQHNDYIRNFRSFIPQRVANESQRLKTGDLLFAGSGETSEEIGKCVAFLGNEVAYAGGDIVIFSPEGQNSQYLGYLMNHTSISVQKARMGQGDAVVHISAKSLAQIEVLLPNFTEQSAIAAILSDMDTEVAALEQKRHKTRLLKQGMMQELLTGKIRLV